MDGLDRLMLGNQSIKKRAREAVDWERRPL
jgi:hypothetical protein